MSEITFVDRLGDALEAAVARAPERVRPRLRGRLGLYLAVGALVAGGTAAAAGLFSSEKQASTSVACYEEASLGGSVAVVWAGDRSPAAICAEALGKPASSLVACASGDSVAVIPGEPGACAAAGLAPLGGAYEPQRRKLAALGRDVIRLETAVDCLAPAELARRIQGLLNRDGWAGWSTKVREGSGDCGSVSGLGGDGRRSLAGALDAEHHVVLVSAAAAGLATMDALYGPRGVVGPLEDASGTACFAPEELVALADRRLAGAGLRAQALAPQPLPEGVEMFGPRGERYTAGCAVIVDVQPVGSGMVTLQVAQRGA